MHSWLRTNVAGIEVLTADADAIRLLLPEPSLELQSSLSSDLTDAPYKVPVITSSFWVHGDVAAASGTHSGPTRSIHKDGRHNSKRKTRRRNRTQASTSPG